MSCCTKTLVPYNLQNSSSNDTQKFAKFKLTSSSHLEVTRTKKRQFWVRPLSPRDQPECLALPILLSTRNLRVNL